MSDMPFESPVEDVAEQQTDVIPDDDSDRLGSSPSAAGIAWDADPADAQEQDVEVPIDEDEWR
jgi:hypothetical protein